MPLFLKIVVGVILAYLLFEFVEHAIIPLAWLILKKKENISQDPRVWLERWARSGSGAELRVGFLCTVRSGRQRVKIPLQLEIERKSWMSRD